jgi:putative nucleotidyltransferase with HDIG domain
MPEMTPKVKEILGQVREIELPPFVMAIIRRLLVAGHSAYVVGGAVRDVCLKRPVSDWDITTSADPARIKATFADIRHFSLKHDTVTLVHENRAYEVTTFRGASGFGRSIEEDLQHRDFTINAMAYEPSQKIVVDIYGGRSDIAKRRIQAVKDPEARFLEDPLRLIRAARIAAELRFRIEPQTLSAMTGLAGEIGTVALERVRDELMKLLMSPKPSVGFNIMRKTSLTVEVLPELLEGYRRRQNAYHRYTIYRHAMESVDRVPPDPILRLTALFHDIAKPRVRTKVEGVWRFQGHAEASTELAQRIMKRLKFSDEVIRRVTHIIAHHMIDYQPEWGEGAVKRWIRRVSPDNLDLLLSFRRADLLAHGIRDRKLEWLGELEHRVKRLEDTPFPIDTDHLAIDGHRVMEILGLSPGPGVGSALEHLLEMVIDRPELNNEADLVAFLKEMKARGEHG